jgi:D-amino-acid dehydrogenase
MPIVGRSPRHRNVIVAVGHAMLGLTLAPVNARWVADLVAGAPEPDAIGPFAPGRFRARPGQS